MAGLRVRVIPSVVLRMFNDFVEGESMKLDCRIGLVLGLFAILFLAACGDETTQVVQEKMSVVKTISDLPGCTSENEGSQALVKGETPVRICVDGEWVSMSELGNDTIYVDEGVSKVYVSEKVSCETKKLSDGSGIKILCNGDSIGTVWNGRDGNDGVDGIDGRDGKDGALDLFAMAAIALKMVPMVKMEPMAMMVPRESLETRALMEKMVKTVSMALAVPLPMRRIPR